MRARSPATLAQFFGRKSHLELRRGPSRTCRWVLSWRYPIMKAHAFQGFATKREARLHMSAMAGLISYSEIGRPATYSVAVVLGNGGSS